MMNKKPDYLQMMANELMSKKSLDEIADKVIKAAEEKLNPSEVPMSDYPIVVSNDWGEWEQITFPDKLEKKKGRFQILSTRGMELYADKVNHAIQAMNRGITAYIIYQESGSIFMHRYEDVVTFINNASSIKLTYNTLMLREWM
jgi:hypothetical protein